MSVRVEVHSTAKRAVIITIAALFFVATLVALKKLAVEHEADYLSDVKVVDAEMVAYIAPTLQFRINPHAAEASWSKSLAQVFHGRTEFPVQNGRVDVLTDEYAIEVERLNKWHEGIGQSKHYATETRKIPCLAIIIEASDIPLSENNQEKLKTIERTALESGVKLLILVAKMPES